MTAENLSATPGSCPHLYTLDAPHASCEFVFEPSRTRAMTIAFEAAWRRLRASRHPCTVDELALETQNQLARRIIEKAGEGEVDPVHLREHALRSLFPLGLDFG